MGYYTMYDGQLSLKNPRLSGDAIRALQSLTDDPETPSWADIGWPYWFPILYDIDDGGGVSLQLLDDSKGDCEEFIIALQWFIDTFLTPTGNVLWGYIGGEGESHEDRWNINVQDNVCTLEYQSQFFGHLIDHFLEMYGDKLSEKTVKEIMAVRIAEEL